MSELQITCHCGAVKYTVTESQDSAGHHPDIDLCHCYGCRHSTGQLYTSYCKIKSPSTASVLSDPGLSRIMTVEGKFMASAYLSNMLSPSTILHFCTTCGCHVFRSFTGPSVSSLEIATGTLAHGLDGQDAQGQLSAAKLGSHVNVESTVDGGLAKWLTRVVVADGSSTAEKHYSSRPAEADNGSTLSASCLCEKVSFRITRPNADSHKPTSGFPDAMIPFHTKDPEIKNPKEVKWWLRHNDTKYMGGLCVCKSCRLTSGFEIQAWAFIPRANIEFRSEAGDDGAWQILDFDGLRRRGVIRGYESSPGVMREFCPRCGATVFWHDKWRPELIDVSAGLLRSSDGVRGESWLHWWAERVSFAEDIDLDRRGSPAIRARLLLEALQEGLGASTSST